MIRIICLLLLLSCHRDMPSDNPVNSNPLHYNLGISFPPVSDEEQREFSAPLLKDLKVTSIRIGENWKFREPIQGTFNWSPLDQRIEWAENNGFDILLTIQSNGPEWACSAQENDNSCVFKNNEYFKNYIEKLLQRYPNKISKIQFGNEWQSNFWYVGNAQEFAAANNIVFDAIQEFSPHTTFVLGGFTTISLRFLAGCNGKINEFYNDEGHLYTLTELSQICNNPEILDVIERIEFVLEHANYDELDIHLYDDVENWPIYFDNFKEMVDKPIIISEFGGPNTNIEPTTEEYQSQRLESYIHTINNLSVDEAYYFKLVEGSNNPAHSESGLINYPDLTKKSSYYTFKELNNR